jgi:hypothetical protein
MSSHAQLEVRESCPWRGDVVAQPIPRDRWFLGCSLSDSTVPELSNVVLSNISGSFARIDGTLSEVGFAKVDYGTSTSALTKCEGQCDFTNGVIRPLLSETHTGFSVALTDLAPNTQYYYRVTAWDLRGNPKVGGVASFWTASSMTCLAGFEGKYYSGMGQDTLATTRVESTMLAFAESASWPPNSPNGNGYSARFSGAIDVPVGCDGQNVTLHAAAKDGVILKLDGVVVIHDFTQQVATKDRTVTARLSKGPHDFELSMYSNTGTGTVRLLWEAPGCGISLTEIPAANLKRCTPVFDTTPPTITATCDLPPQGQLCSTANELTVYADDSCRSPDPMAAPTALFSDPSGIQQICWGATSATSCAGATGWPASFNFGTTLVKFMAIDNLGNAATANLAVRVVDIAPPDPPTVTLSSTVAVGWGSPKVVAIESPVGCDLTFQATAGSATPIAWQNFDAISADNCGIQSFVNPGSTVVPLGGPVVV